MNEKLAREYIPGDVESRWYEAWIEGGYFHADETSERPPFCIVIPPPNVTGKLHMGHALFVTIQDLLTRFKRMQGYEALWLPGTDHAGIATQVMVERQLAREGLDRHALGREAFIERVWRWKEEKGGAIIEQMKVMGASCDWARERFTLDEGLSRAVGVAFARMHEEGLIYRAERLVNWDPGSQTVLSDLEVEQAPEKGHLWHIAYPVVGSERRLVVATTRPETMLGDTAVAVHPDDARYQDLIGGMLELPLTGRQIPIVADEMVDPAFGSGAVKITPAHDFNDFEVAQRHGLGLIQVIGLDARITDAAPEAYQGLTREAARDQVVADLDAGGFLVETEAHDYMPGRSQRSGEIVEPLPMTQWWVKTPPLAKPAIEAVEQGATRMLPEMWEKTYFNWMHNIRDWCISRQLWWGHQIPAWYRPDDPDVHTLEDGRVVIGPSARYVVAAERPASWEGVAGEDLIQDPDVLDTWFSSGLWPFSTMGWPEETATLAKFYPTTVMETGSDIIFFWVARMMMMGLHFTGQAPFETVYFHAMVRDKNGDKMSKTKGNVVDPLHVINGVDPAALEADEREACASLFEDYPQGVAPQGADALRLTLAIYAAQGRDIRLDLKRVEGYRAFLNKLWQATRFTLLNLGDDGAVVAQGGASGALPIAAEDLSLTDAWILERLAQTVAQVTRALEAFQLNEAAQTIYDFVWNQLCDWYIEFAKPVLYDRGEANAAALSATRHVLVHALETVTRLLHPITPFVTEEIWQALPRAAGGPASICVAPWPTTDAAPRCPAQAAEVERMIAVIQALRTLRGESGIKPGQRIPRLIVFTDDPGARALIEAARVHIERLARVEAIALAAAGDPRPGAAATTVAEGIELVVPFAGLIDVDEEVARIEKAIGKLDKDIARSTKKLDNDKFTSRAPAEVVQTERERLAADQAERAKLEAALGRLRGA